MKLRILFVFLIGMFFSSCESYVHELETIKGNWKYGDGSWVGDFICIDSSSYRNDTIFILGNPKATILTLETYPDLSKHIIIENIQTGEKGTYHKK